MNYAKIINKYIYICFLLFKNILYNTAKLLNRIDFLILSHLAWQELSRGVASIVAIALWFALVLVLNQWMF